MYAQLMKRQKANSLGNITWSELGKQNIKAKKIYFLKVADKSVQKLLFFYLFALKVGVIPVFTAGFFWSFLSQAISGEVRFAPGLLASSIG